MRKLVDSGIDWVGAVPENWKFKKGKYLFQLRSERGNTIELQLLSPTQKFGCIPQSLYEELTGANAVKLNEKTDLNLLKTIHRGDFCISLRSFQGGFEYSDYEGVVSPAYQVFYPTRNDVYRGYYKYMFKDGAFIDKMNSFTLSLRDGKNIAFADFGNTLLPRPSFEEQRTIADYLDKKTSEIDAAIKEAQELIEKYKAYKQSVITEIVTKGLDPQVPMKDSGVEWIGEIPVGWKIGRIKNVLKDSSLQTITGEGEQLSVTQSSGIVKTSEIQVANPSLSQAGWKIVNVGDIVFNKYKAHSGVFFVSPYDGIVTFNYSVYHCYKKIFPKYYVYLFKTSRCIGEFRKAMKGVGESISPLYTCDLFKIHTVIPPFEDQEAIAYYLDNKCSQIDTIIAQKENLISKLQEYKKSIIFEYVTGKKEVPNG